jgi:hypothetical protein
MLQFKDVESSKKSLTGSIFGLVLKNLKNKKYALK